MNKFSSVTEKAKVTGVQFIYVYIEIRAIDLLTFYTILLIYLWLSYLFQYYFYRTHSINMWRLYVQYMLNIINNEKWGLPLELSSNVSNERLFQATLFPTFKRNNAFIIRFYNKLKAVLSCSYTIQLKILEYYADRLC